jgi:hypothetical protein
MTKVKDFCLEVTGSYFSRGKRFSMLVPAGQPPQVDFQVNQSLLAGAVDGTASATDLGHG